MSTYYRQKIVAGVKLNSEQTKTVLTDKKYCEWYEFVDEYSNALGWHLDVDNHGKWIVWGRLFLDKDIMTGPDFCSIGEFYLSHNEKEDIIRIANHVFKGKCLFTIHDFDYHIYTKWM